jgi:hypothetical protein
MKKLLLTLVLLTGCTTPLDTRTCLDWKSSIEVIEECTPLYGNVICVTKEKPRYWCVLYDESSTEQQNLYGSNSRATQAVIGRANI